MNNVKVVHKKETIMKSDNFPEAVTQKLIQRKDAPKVRSTPVEKHPYRRANPGKARRQ